MIKRELTRFFIVGSLTVLFDFLSYRSLIRIELMTIDLAKTTSFLLGTSFAYFANRFWTFNLQTPASKSIWRFMLLYTTTLGVNVFVNALTLQLIGNITAAISIAFICATGASTCLNFLGMKLYVFKNVLVSERL